MRTSILCAAFLGLFAVGCAGDLSGTGDDTGGDDVQATCGDGTMNEGEACDDGNTDSNDGCSSTCQVEAIPRVAVMVDKPTVTTDLYVDNEVSVTLTSMSGFAGTVTLAASAVDGTGAAIMGWTVALDVTTVDVAVDGTASAKLNVRVPGDTATVTGSIKITATSSAAPQETTVNVTGSNRAVITYTTTGENCVYPTNFNIANPVRIKLGRELRITNGGPATGQPTRSLQVHFDGGYPGISHQGAPMVALANYDQTADEATPGANVTFYCHNANQPGVVAVEAVGGAARQRLIVVP
jgi:cysteine-rich repeat protein